MQIHHRFDRFLSVSRMGWEPAISELVENEMNVGERSEINGKVEEDFQVF